MNRREFTKALGAALALPALPVKAAAAVPAAAKIAYSQHYMWGAFIARVHDKASPAMFARYFNLDAQEAEKLCSELVRDKVISAPNAAGVSQASAPYQRSAMDIANLRKPFEPKTLDPEAQQLEGRQDLTDGQDLPSPEASEDHAPEVEAPGDDILREDGPRAEAQNIDADSDFLNQELEGSGHDPEPEDSSTVSAQEPHGTP